MSNFRKVVYRLLVDADMSGIGYEELADQLEALHQKHSVPDEPTEDMVRAGTGWREYDTDYYMGSNERNMVYRIYKAMIAAAKENSIEHQPASGD